jgi:hypothetical protein
VCDERGAKRGQQKTGRAMVHTLTADPEAPPYGVDADQAITVCPWPPGHETSMIVSIRSFRKFRLLAVPLAVLAMGAAGCGGDDEDKPAVSTQAYTDMVPDTTATTETQTDSTPTEVDPETETLPNDGNGTGTGEGGTGGAGDELPAQTLALFTVENGRVTPRRVQVPAFISVRVELRSRDGAEHTLTIGDKAITAGGELSSASTTFDGLRPGAKLVGKVSGGAGRVVVSATAEPGP